MLVGWNLVVLDAALHVVSIWPYSALHACTPCVCSLQRWPEAELHIIGNAGHSSTEVDIEAKLVEAADKYKEL